MDRLCMGCMEPLKKGADFCPKCGYRLGTPPQETFHISPGTVLEKRYIVGRVLGFGGFGVTYLAYDTVLGVKIAIKEYLPGEFSTRVPNQLKLTVYTGDREGQFLTGKDKFIDEARRLAKFQNVPEVVHVYTCFEANETAYIVMEYLEGETLRSKLDREGTMRVEQALPIIFHVLHALEAVHGAGLLHRDVSPDNIFITMDGQVKLLDFGAARFATTTHSKSLTVLIKPGFAPEEQYRSRGDQGPWTDVYSLAATFYNMITGIIPQDALERAVKDTVKEPSKLGVKIGENTEIALMNAMNVKIEARTKTAKQFEEELLANVVTRVVLEKRQIDLGKWPLWIKAAAALAGAGIAGFAILIAAGVIRFDIAGWSNIAVPDGKVRVPNVVNVEMEEAIARGEQADLTVLIYDKQYSDTIPENRVLSQDIKGGTVVAANGTLGVIISAGIEKTYIPNVIGMESDQAIQVLKDAGLVVSSSEEEFRAAPGTVGWQSLEAETEADTGTEIKIIISQGIQGGDETVSEIVQDLTGKEYDQAADELLTKYLYLVNRGGEYSDEFPAGSIIRQDPPAGVTLSQNSNIFVTVSLGKELVYVPDVQYKTESEAVSMFEAAGIEADIRQEASTTVAAGNVIRQEVPAGERIEKGAQVVIYISTGAPARTRAQETPRPSTENSSPAAEQAQTAAESTQADEVPATEPGRNPAFDIL